ncbi:MAG: transporter [Clostridia bacterium]|nr:transporter [Clostridia bacterium]
MNIYIRELRAHRKSLIIWSVSMIFLIIAGMGKYSASSGAGAESFNELISQMPKSLQSLFGVGVFDLSNVIDYFGVLFIYIALVATIHAVMLGSGIISKEERDKTVEFLMVKPISRQNIVTSKILSALTIILIFNIVTLISSFLMLTYYSKDDFIMTELIKLMLALFLLQIFFVILGAFFAALINKPKLSSAVSTSVLMVMFMLSVIVDIVGNIDFLKYFTVFKYFDSKDILKGGYNFIYPILIFILLFIFSTGIYFFYKKRDLKI